MSLDGLWTTEIYGMFGWEKAGVLVLTDGHALGGGNNHISAGTFVENGDEVEIVLQVDYHGTPRTLFGSDQREFEVHIKGKIVEGSVEGQLFREDKRELSLAIRMTKRADTP